MFTHGKCHKIPKIKVMSNGFVAMFSFLCKLIFDLNIFGKLVVGCPEPGKLHTREPIELWTDLKPIQDTNINLNTNHFHSNFKYEILSVATGFLWCIN